MKNFLRHGTLRGIDFDKVQEQIVNARADADQLDDVERSAIRADLCGFLRQRHAEYVRQNDTCPTPELDQLCAAVFSISIVSAYVESLFSKMEYNQNKTRNRLKDSTMSAILHVHDAVLPTPEKRLPLSLDLQLHSQPVMQHKMKMRVKVDSH